MVVIVRYYFYSSCLSWPLFLCIQLFAFPIFSFWLLSPPLLRVHLCYIIAVILSMSLAARGMVFQQYTDYFFHIGNGFCRQQAATDYANVTVTVTVTPILH